MAEVAAAKDTLSTAFAMSLLEDVYAKSVDYTIQPEVAFTRLVLERFNVEGITEDAAAVAHIGRGIEVSGYGLSGDQQFLDLFVTSYSHRADPAHKINKSEIEACLKRLEAFRVACTRGIKRRFDPATDLHGMCEQVQEASRTGAKVRLILLTNARNVARGPALSFAGAGPQVEVWDLVRLARLDAAGSAAEPIVAEFTEGLPFLAEPATDSDYSVFLTIIGGVQLAELYDRHGPQLLELNVRSFLQIRGGVNKGILRTLVEHPERFLAYNNGISATASNVEFREDRGGNRVIDRIRDLQIVNGGQTTASLHYALKRARADIRPVRVQMKLTVVSPERLDTVVPQISAFSNTQNKVTTSDLRANTGFHVDVERVMRSLWMTSPVGGPDTQWFYERARGQYADAVARLNTPAKRRRFKTTNPSSQKFTKADLAKFENTWAQLPHIVSRGAEKNFTHFTERLEAEPVSVDKAWCQRLISKAILFRRADRIVDGRDFGGYKINIVSFTVALLAYHAGSLVDLDRIWRAQALWPELEAAIAELCVSVQQTITRPPDGRTHVGEWTKKEECWKAVRDIDWQPGVALGGTSGPDLPAEFVRRIVVATPAGSWRELADWGERTGLLSSEERRTVAEFGQYRRREAIPPGKFHQAAVAIMDRAVILGFGPVPGFPLMQEQGA